MKKSELGVCFGVPSFVSCGVPPPFTFLTPHACLLGVFSDHVSLVLVENRVGLSSFVIKGNDVPY